MSAKSEPAKRPVNLSLSQDLLQEARKLEINLSRAAERGIAEAVVEQKRTLWRAKSKQALDSWNEFVEREGLPLGKYHKF